MSSQPKKQAWLSHVIEDVFFSEAWLGRFLRNNLLRASILIYVVLAARWFDAPTDPYDWGIKALRYFLAPLAAVLTAALVGARYLQDIYELPSYRAALRYLRASLLASPSYYSLSRGFLPTLTISKGEKVQDEDEEVSLLDRVGGPGWLTVEPGNVVLLEHLHAPAEVVGAGTHFIPPFLRVQEIISLEDQHWKADPILATTKDGIQVEVQDFQFTYRLCSSRRENQGGRRTPLDPYPFSIKAVRDLAYGRNVRADGAMMSWGGSMQFRVDGAITDFINRSTIEQVIAPGSEDPRKDIMKEIYGPQLRTRLKNFLGSELTWANIGCFQIHDETIRETMKQYRVESWSAQSAGKAALILAQGRAQQISQEEGGRSENTATMLKSIIQALDEAQPTGEANEHLWNIVLARTAQVIEAMTSLYDTDIPKLPDQEKSD